MLEFSISTFIYFLLFAMQIQKALNKVTNISHFAKYSECFAVLMLLDHS